MDQLKIALVLIILVNADTDVYQRPDGAIVSKSYSVSPKFAKEPAAGQVDSSEWSTCSRECGGEQTREQGCDSASPNCIRKTESRECNKAGQMLEISTFSTIVSVYAPESFTGVTPAVVPTYYSFTKL